jgi:hypothetical protein
MAYIWSFYQLRHFCEYLIRCCVDNTHHLKWHFSIIICKSNIWTLTFYHCRHFCIITRSGDMQSSFSIITSNVNNFFVGFTMSHSLVDK